MSLEIHYTQFTAISHFSFQKSGKYHIIRMNSVSFITLFV